MLGSHLEKHLWQWMVYWIRQGAGPRYLQQPAVADMAVEAVRYNADVLGHHILHAFVVMPNHVHMLVTPLVSRPKLMRSIKGITARRANSMLRLAETHFRPGESLDHVVRNEGEFERIVRTSRTVRFARVWRDNPKIAFGQVQPTLDPRLDVPVQ